MKAFLCIVLIVVAAILGGATGCREKPSAFPLSLATLEKIQDGQISFEVRGDEIFVHVIDRFGDAHIHRLDRQGVSKQKALEILKDKEIELARVNTESGDAEKRSQPIRSETNST